MSMKAIKSEDTRPDPGLSQIEDQLDGFFSKVAGAWKTMVVLVLIVAGLWLFGGQILSNYGQYLLYATVADKARRTAQFTTAMQNMKILAEGGTLPPAPARGAGGPPAGTPPSGR